MRIVIVLFLLAFSTLAIANLQCGLKPIKPIGCDYLLCIDGKWRCVSE